MFNKTKILNIMDRPHDSLSVFIEHLSQIEELLYRKDNFFLKLFNLKKSKFYLSLQERFLLNIKPYFNDENSKLVFEKIYIKYFQHKNYLIPKQNCVVDCTFLIEALKINSDIIIKDIVNCNKNNTFFFKNFFNHIDLLKEYSFFNINDNQLINIFDYINSEKEFIYDISSEFSAEHYFFKIYSLYLQKDELKNTLENF